MKLKLVYIAALILCMPMLHAENGYDLWLRYQKVDNSQLLNSYSKTLAKLNFPVNSATLTEAKKELQQGLDGLLDTNLPETDGISKGTLLVGTPASSKVLSGIHAITNEISGLGDEGFLIKTLKVNGTPCTVIAARKDMGVMYGVFHFLRLLFPVSRQCLLIFRNFSLGIVIALLQQKDQHLIRVFPAFFPVFQLQGQKSQLETTIAKKKKEVSNFDSQLAQAKNDAAAYAKTVEKKNQEIQKAKEEEARKKREAEEARKKAEAEAAKKKSSATTTSKKTSANDKYPGPAAVKSSGGSAQGRAVADYGLQFVGNPYVYGGTSLTNGADCSGFVQQVYKHFGYSLPRSSSEQRSAGREVSYSEAQPGDLICYAGHVAIYIGNGQIVHASTPTTGIKVGTATYRTILSVRRIV